MKPKLKLLLSVSAVLLATVAIALPVSNLLSPRTILPCKSSDLEMVSFSKTFQLKCADCHSPEMMRSPAYTNLPIAKTIIDRDVAEAQQSFVISREQLEGAVPLTDIDLKRIRTEIDEGAMPPFRYKLMHWNSGIGEAERKQLLSWIDRKRAESGVKAPATKSPSSPESDRR